MTTTEQLSLTEILGSLSEAEVMDEKGLVPGALDGMNDDQIEGLASYFGAVNSGLRFTVGDLLNWVEVNRSEMYEQMQHKFGLSFSTLRSYASVAAAVARVRRRTPEISWSHHEAIATLPAAAQRKWLDRIAREGWTVEETREARRTADADGEPGNPDTGLDHIGQSVAEVARSVWIASSRHGEVYHVPAEPMLRLARAIGEPV